MPDTSVLETIKSVYDITNPTVKDFMPDNSTGDINQEKQSNEDFFPGANQGINAGTYSGSEVGSIPIYAPQGELVPFAAYGARDRAVEKAAQERMKDFSAFQKQIEYPQTKLHGVQNDLSNHYSDFLEKSIPVLKKKYGREWPKMAMTDTVFLRGNQAFKDAVSFYDQFPEQFAKDDELIKQGKFLPTQGYLDTRKDLLDATKLFDNMDHPLMQKVSQNMRRFPFERDFGQIAKEWMDGKVKQILAHSGVNPDNPDYYKLWKNEESKFTDDQFKSFSHDIKRTIYPTSDVWDEPTIYAALKSGYGNIQQKSSTSIQQKRDGDGGETFDEVNIAESNHPINVQPLATVATQGAPQKETSLNLQNYSQFTKAITPDQAAGPTIYPTIVVERKKSDKVIKEGGLFPTQQPEDRKAVIGGIGIGDVDVSTGRPVTPEQIAANPNLKTKKAVLVHGNYPSTVNMEVGSVDEYGEPVKTVGDGKTGATVPFLAQASDYKNFLKNKKVKGGAGIYDYLQKKADEMNKGKFSAAAPVNKNIMTGKSKSGKDIISKDGGKTWIYK